MSGTFIVGEGYKTNYISINSRKKRRIIKRKFISYYYWTCMKRDQPHIYIINFLTQFTILNIQCSSIIVS